MRYVEVGDEFEDEEYKPRRPKWTIPSSDFQRRVLAAVGRKYWPIKLRGKPAKYLRSKIIMVEKSLTTDIEGAAWPMDWVNSVLSWVRSKRRKREFVDLDGLVTYLYDGDKKREWMERQGAQGSSDYEDSPYS